NDILTRIALKRSKRPAKIYDQMNRVMIFQAGHILPGYMERIGKTFRLYGIETTVKGKGIVDFGPVENLSVPIRVVKANDFIAQEIFKSYLSLDEANMLAENMLESAANEYGIPLKNLEEIIRSKSGEIAESTQLGKTNTRIDNSDSSTIDAPNSSVFSFGTAEVPDGDIEMQTVDQFQPWGGHTFKAPKSERSKAKAMTAFVDYQNAEPTKKSLKLSDLCKIPKSKWVVTDPNLESLIPTVVASALDPLNGSRILPYRESEYHGITTDYFDCVFENRPGQYFGVNLPDTQDLLYYYYVMDKYNSMSSNDSKMKKSWNEAKEVVWNMCKELVGDIGAYTAVVCKAPESFFGFLPVEN
ncbi:MAG: hypothetical protein KDD25_05880, partial [Bdellovibrionales bacterium]|nr:hypothetical protein [Bdellovibrionales bacterium]